MNVSNKTVSVSVHDFKLVVIDKELSDADILKLFPEVVLNSEDDIRELVGVLKKHRPKVAQQLEQQLDRRVREQTT